MANPPPYSGQNERQKAVGLRPTRQRLALAKLLFGPGNRHVSAEQLHGEAVGAQVRVSLATVYNTLHPFTAVGFLREVVVEPGRSYFDTNVEDHHHFYFEETGRIEDIQGHDLREVDLPEAPAGTRVARVDIIVRVAEDR